MDDLYKILGVPKTSSADQIKKAYRDAAFKYHPDRNPGDKVAEENFKKINAAYSVLGDSTKRAEYDQFGSDGFATNQRSAYGNQTNNQYGQSPYGEDFWGWYEQQTNAQRQQRQYRQSYSYNNNGWDKSPKTKKEAFSALIRSLLVVVGCFYFLRWSWILLPIGPILCLLGIVRGATGFIQAIQVLFKKKES
jgi:molecular chaperone DnaJ